MLETPHVAFGIAIATVVPNPLISIPLAFASHFILDMTPHWNPHLNTELKKYGHLTKQTLLIIGVDLICAVLLTVFLAKGDINIYLAAFASILPDVAEAPHYIFGIKNKYLQIWINLQKSIQASANIFWGLLTQALVLFGSLYILS